MELPFRHASGKALGSYGTDERLLTGETGGRIVLSFLLGKAYSTNESSCSPARVEKRIATNIIYLSTPREARMAHAFVFVAGETQGLCH